MIDDLDLVRALRSSGMTMRELSIALSVSPITLRRWLQGKARPSPLARAQMSMIFGREREAQREQYAR